MACLRLSRQCVHLLIVSGPIDLLKIIFSSDRQQPLDVPRLIVRPKAPPPPPVPAPHPRQRMLMAARGPQMAMEESETIDEAMDSITQGPAAGGGLFGASLQNAAENTEGVVRWDLTGRHSLPRRKTKNITFFENDQLEAWSYLHAVLRGSDTLHKCVRSCFLRRHPLQNGAKMYKHGSPR